MARNGVTRFGQPRDPGPHRRRPPIASRERLAAALGKSDEGKFARMDHLVIEHQIERRRRRRRGLIALLSALTALTLGAGSFSLAQFTDTETSTWSFTAGGMI